MWFKIVFMKLLVVSATAFEIKPLLDVMGVVPNDYEPFLTAQYKSLQIDVLITGVGMAATAYYLGKILRPDYQLVINAGICGSFNANLSIGEVVNIYEDSFSELGAEDGKRFLSLKELNLKGITSVTNVNPYANEVLDTLPKVNGITVNTVHGNEDSIKTVFEKFHPFVESMEGAAFMMACDLAQVAFAQLRAVSNYVEPRNKENWNIPLAIKNLNLKVIELLDSFA